MGWPSHMAATQVAPSASPQRALRTSVLREQFDLLQQDWTKLNASIHRGHSSALDRSSSTEHQRPGPQLREPPGRSSSVGPSQRWPEGKQGGGAGQKRPDIKGGTLECIKESSPAPTGQAGKQAEAADRFRSPARPRGAAANAGAPASASSASPGVPLARQRPASPGQARGGPGAPLGRPASPGMDRNRAAAATAVRSAAAADPKSTPTKVQLHPAAPEASQSEKKKAMRKWTPPPWNDAFAGLPADAAFQNMGSDQGQRQRTPHTPGTSNTSRAPVVSSAPSTPQQQMSRPMAAPAKNAAPPGKAAAAPVPAGSDIKASKIPSPGPGSHADSSRRAASPGPRLQTPPARAASNQRQADGPHSHIPHADPDPDPLKLSDDLAQQDDRLARRVRGSSTSGLSTPSHAASAPTPASISADGPQLAAVPAKPRKTWDVPSTSTSVEKESSGWSTEGRSLSPRKPCPPVAPAASTPGPAKRPSSGGSSSSVPPGHAPPPPSPGPVSARQAAEADAPSGSLGVKGTKDEGYLRKLSALKRGSQPAGAGAGVVAGAARTSAQDRGGGHVLEGPPAGHGGLPSSSSAGSVGYAPLAVASSSGRPSSGGAPGPAGLPPRRSSLNDAESCMQAGGPRPPSASRPDSSGPPLLGAGGAPALRAPSPRTRAARSSQNSSSLSISSSLEASPGHPGVSGRPPGGGGSSEALNHAAPAVGLQQQRVPAVSSSVDMGADEVMMGSVMGSQIFNSPSPVRSSSFSPRSAESAGPPSAPAPAPAPVHGGARAGALSLEEHQFLQYAASHPELALAAAAAVSSSQQAQAQPSAEPSDAATPTRPGQRAKWQMPDVPSPNPYGPAPAQGQSQGQGQGQGPPPWEAELPAGSRMQWQVPPSLQEEQVYGPPAPSQPAWQQQQQQQRAGPYPAGYGQQQPQQWPQAPPPGLWIPPTAHPSYPTPPPPPGMEQQQQQQHKPASAGYSPHDSGVPDYMLQRSLSNNDVWNPTWPGRGGGGGGTYGPVQQQPRDAGWGRVGTGGAIDPAQLPLPMFGNAPAQRAYQPAVPPWALDTPGPGAGPHHYGAAGMAGGMQPPPPPGPFQPWPRGNYPYGMAQQQQQQQQPQYPASSQAAGLGLRGPPGGPGGGGAPGAGPWGNGLAHTFHGYSPMRGQQNANGAPGWGQGQSQGQGQYAEPYHHAGGAAGPMQQQGRRDAFALVRLRGAAGVLWCPGKAVGCLHHSWGWAELG